VKWLVSRRVKAAGAEIGSRAVEADAWHHLSDAVTSAAAFVGISVALVMGPGWEPADDWAALVAAGVIFANGALMLKGALFDLMDRTPEAKVVAEVRRIAEGVEGVLAIEKLAVRRAGINLFVDIHVQAPGLLPLEQAHTLGGKVKSAIRSGVKGIAGVLVHMEPFTGLRAESVDREHHSDPTRDLPA
ncbi:MAG: cation diffusion facilitator family transporter, partial [Planctomycetaceae bacterium]